jgi:predicted TIM-barrel fold metal-dependent hydrolase
MPVVDAHTHVFAPGQVAARDEICGRDLLFAELYTDPKAKLADGPQLLRALDEAGIERAVAAGFAFSTEREIAAQDEYLVASSAESGGRIAALAAINLSLPGWEAMFDRALAAGARGFGELRPGNQGWHPLGSDARRFYQAASEAGAVLLWHMSEPVGHRYPGKAGGLSPADLVRITEDFPGLRMVAAHMGAGLPYFLQMPEVRGALQHVYFDTAAYSLLYDDQSVARLVDLAGPGRVIFGSDYPLLSPRRQLERVRALLPAGAVQAVCGDTAGTLFWDTSDR